MIAAFSGHTYLLFGFNYGCTLNAVLKKDLPNNEWALNLIPKTWMLVHILWAVDEYTVKPVLSNHFQKDRKLVFKTNYCLLQVKSIAECCKEHSAILLTFIKLPFLIKIFVLSIFEWPLMTGFTVLPMCNSSYVEMLPVSGSAVAQW